MKKLKEFIIENYTNESIWDIDNNIEDNNEEFIKDKIKKFINDNYYGVVIYKPARYEIIKEGDKYIVNSKFDINNKKGLKQLTNNLFEWGEVNNFRVHGNDLESLEGAPKIVKRVFELVDCKQLEDLSNTPKKMRISIHF